MKQSESITKLLENFTKAQAEFPTLPKDKNGYNYRYTDLDTVISTVRPILAKYNIGFMQALTTLESGKWAISTRIFNTAECVTFHVSNGSSYILCCVSLCK